MDSINSPLFKFSLFFDPLVFGYQVFYLLDCFFHFSLKFNQRVFLRLYISRLCCASSDLKCLNVIYKTVGNGKTVFRYEKGLKTLM